MFLSKKSVFLPLALSILVIAPASAKTPKTFLGKIAASTLQTINKHPYATSYSVIGATMATIALVSNRTEIIKDLASKSFFSAFAVSYIVETGSKALMRNFEVDPIQ